VFSLVASAYGLDARRDFVEVCTVAAELAGAWHLVDELRGAAERRPAPAPKPRLEPIPERDYPPIDEVRAMLTGPAWEDDAACAYLRSRAIDPKRLEAASVGVTFAGVQRGGVAYSLDVGAELPRWARYQGKPWTETGHGLLVPVVDAAGQLRSVRAVRIKEGESPKRLPPGGHRAAGLVMANDLALALLRGSWTPSLRIRVALRIVEGEPDFLTAVPVRASIATAVLGIVSGSWGPAFSARVPPHALVAVQTHNDTAGDRYAAEIAESLAAVGVSVVARITP
jgi:hypothetical protein